MYRQGDVLLIPTTEEVPADATPEKAESGRMILMHGEATGHAHAVLERDAGIRSRGTGMTIERWLDVHKPAVLTHEEHTHIPLAPGRYKILQQREYSPEAIRNVVD